MYVPLPSLQDAASYHGSWPDSATTNKVEGEKMDRIKKYMAMEMQGAHSANSHSGATAAHVVKSTYTFHEQENTNADWWWI